MSTPVEIYNVHAPPAPPPLPAGPPRTVAPVHRPNPRLRRAIPWLWWIAALAFTVCIGIWAFRAGIDLRDQVWRSSRSIRFTLDIRRAFSFGSQVITLAESRAHLPPFSDRLAGQSPAVLAKLTPFGRARAKEATRRLTWHELEQGWVHYYEKIEADARGGDFDLDYPPMRLAVVTLWARHAQRENPRVMVYPNTPRDRLDWVSPMPEDVAASILDFNSACDGIAAVAIFLLVWLWMSRGAAGRIKPPRSIWPHGLLAFVVATGGFWYALVVLASPPPRPTPSVYVRGASFAPDHATVVALINPEMSTPATCRVDWGATEAYGHATPNKVLLTINDSGEDRRVTFDLPIHREQTIHLRVSAASPAGVTHSDDFVLRNQGGLVRFDGPVFGGVAWPDWTVWLRLLALFTIMVVAAQRVAWPLRGWACGLVAALLVWFDPMNLIDSHMWPQWDVWMLPAFLIPALLASVDWWLCAGIVLGAGCMFKGQLLLGGPMLLLWPLLAGRLGPTVRILSGFLIGAAIIVWPWTINDQGLHWLELVMFAAVLVLVGALFRLRSLRRMGRQWITASAVHRETPIAAAIFVAVYLPAALAMLLVFWHLPPHPDLPDLALVLFLLAIIVPPWLLRPRWCGYWLAAVFAAAVWITPLLYHGDYSWLRIGFEYGTIRHDTIAMGQGSYSNLGALLGRRFDWGYHDVVGTLRVSFPFFKWHGQLDVKACLAIISGVCLLASSAAAAMHSRRRDPRFLLTLIVPWIVMPLVLGQMGSRYLLWAAVISCVTVGISTGLTLLHVLLSILATGMVGMQLLRTDPARWPAVYKLFANTYPDIGWMMLLIAGIYLVSAMIPSRRPELL